MIIVFMVRNGTVKRTPLPSALNDITHISASVWEVCELTRACKLIRLRNGLKTRTWTLICHHNLQGRCIKLGIGYKSSWLVAMQVMIAKRDTKTYEYSILPCTKSLTMIRCECCAPHEFNNLHTVFFLNTCGWQNFSKYSTISINFIG